MVARHDASIGIVALHDAPLHVQCAQASKPVCALASFLWSWCNTLSTGKVTSGVVRVPEYQTKHRACGELGDSNKTLAASSLHFT